MDNIGYAEKDYRWGAIITYRGAKETIEEIFND